MRSFTRQALPGTVVFGHGALAQLPEQAALLGAARPLLLAGATPTLTAQVEALLPDRVGTWNDIRQHVPAELADQCHRHAVEVDADLLVCVGGGSTTGLAKAVALRGGPRILAVATTYAGSEMTPVWGQSQDGVKRTGRDPRVLPVTVLYDPDLLTGLPPGVVGPSGMNALAHCVEALYATAAEPLSSLAAVEGARLLARHLPSAFADSDPHARGDVLWASCLAGHVFGTVGGSLHHAVCHLLGGRHDLPHAETHAIVLPHVVQLLLPAVREQLRPLADVLQVEPEGLPGALWDVGAAVNIPVGLESVGMPQADLGAAAQALLDKDPPSPLPLDLARARQLLDDAFAGRRPVS